MGPGSGVEFIVNEPYVNGPRGSSGQYTYKIYHVEKHIPCKSQCPFMPPEAFYKYTVHSCSVYRLIVYGLCKWSAKISESTDLFLSAFISLSFFLSRVCVCVCVLRSVTYSIFQLRTRQRGSRRSCRRRRCRLRRRAGQPILTVARATAVPSSTSRASRFRWTRSSSPTTPRPRTRTTWRQKSSKSARSVRSSVHRTRRRERAAQEPVAQVWLSHRLICNKLIRNN